MFSVSKISTVYIPSTSQSITKEITMSYRGSYIQYPFVSPVPLRAEQVKEIKDRLQLLSKVWDEE